VVAQNRKDLKDKLKGDIAIRDEKAKGAWVGAFHGPYGLKRGDPFIIPL